MTRRREFINGIVLTLPMVLGAIPFGIIFGARAIEAGFSLAETLSLSLFVFAGSAQFIGVILYDQGATLGIIVLTTFVVNLRHMLYSTSLGPHMKNLSQKWLPPLAFWLTDETYAIVVTRYQKTDPSPHKHWFHLGSAVIMYVNWNLCTIIGALAGQRFAGLNQLGLDFALTVIFIGIVIPLIVNRPMLVCALVAAGTSIVTYNMPNRLGLIVAAIVGIAAGMLAEAINNHRRTSFGQSFKVEKEVS